ncbi:MAG: type II toxin-antitoxin system VapC family toxin [Candidatus Eremiobacteraeota bacterium]|nr:type II toxin-antitoxin system VapC family toxin [Candidatus Eremiobacteraeota bacterium]
MMMVVDASVLLSAYFPDEDTHMKAQTLMGNCAADMVELFAPRFARYEIINACHVAFRRGRVILPKALQISEAIHDMVSFCEDDFDAAELLELSERYQICTYDAIYLAQAGSLGAPLITADRKLFERVAGKKGDIMWIGNYSA